MSANDYGYMEVLTGNPYQEAENIASSSYLSNKYFDRYYSMSTLFYYFTHEKWRIILSTHTLSLAALENNSWVSESGIATI